MNIMWNGKKGWRKDEFEMRIDMATDGANRNNTKPAPPQTGIPPNLRFSFVPPKWALLLFLSPSKHCSRFNVPVVLIVVADGNVAKGGRDTHSHCFLFFFGPTLSQRWKGNCPSFARLQSRSFFPPSMLEVGSASAVSTVVEMIWKMRRSHSGISKDETRSTSFHTV